MNRMTKIKITELNPHVICVLCGGYYVDATTIIECLHSFCRTCIMKYLETSKYCPICDVMVHKTRPLDHIRSDKTLQDLVYKLVPSLYRREMKRRRDYYSKHPIEGHVSPSEDHGAEFHDRIIYTEDEKISLSMELCAEGKPFKTPSQVHGHTGPANIKVSDTRFLFCPAAFTVGNLKKFIRMKFDLPDKTELDVFQTAEPLQDYYTLMDIAYIYTWTRRAPLRLYYTVYERKRTQHQTDISNTVKQKQSVVLKETSNISKNASHLPPKSVGGVQLGKRKLEEEEEVEDIDLPQLKVKDTTKSKEGKADGATSKKRAKKQAVIDSSVLEAMSESEEQLAKLTLDCEADSKSEGKNVLSPPLSKIARTNGEVKADEKCTAEKQSDAKDGELDPSAISISLFQPLNAKNTRDADSVKSPDKLDAGDNKLKRKVKPGKKKGTKDGTIKATTKKTPGKQNKRPTSVKSGKRKPNGENIPNGQEPETDIYAYSEPKTKKSNVKTNKSQLNGGTPKTKKQATKATALQPGPGSQQKLIKSKSAQKFDVSEDKVCYRNAAEETNLDKTDLSTDTQPMSVDLVSDLTVTPEANTPQSREPALPEASNETPLFNLPLDLPMPLYGKTPKMSYTNLAISLPLKGNDVRETYNGGGDFRQQSMVGGLSDQPLDLSPGSRDEYTQGKIFKTKLLKKPCPKPDLMQEQKDRYFKQNGHNLEVK